MAIRLIITKEFYDNVSSKNTSTDDTFDLNFQKMIELNELLTFDVIDIDETTREEILIFRDEEAFTKFKGLFTQNNDNLRSFNINSIEYDYQV